MTPKDWLEVLAVLLSPLIAVQVSELIRARQEQRNRRFDVFRTLMATRAANLTVSHVEALNMIDVAFYGTNNRSKAVVEACKVYLDHHNNSPGTPNWSDKRQDLLIDLLQKMAVCLGYEFDKVSIRRTSYFPVGFGRMEAEQQQIRELVLAVLRGERSVPVAATSLSVAPVPATQAPQLDTPIQRTIAAPTPPTTHG